jgi:hypothetical protein
MTSITERLAYGGSSALDLDFVAEAAWGARAIMRGGYPDVPHDRHGYVSRTADGKEKLKALLKKHNPIRLAEEYLASHTVAQDEVVVILDSDDLVVRGRLAGGYLHLAAFLKEAPVTYDEAITAYEEAKKKADAAYQEFLYLEMKARDLMDEAERAAADESAAAGY